MRFAQIAWKFEGLQFGHRFFQNYLIRLGSMHQNVREHFYFLDSKGYKILHFWTS